MSAIIVIIFPTLRARKITRTFQVYKVIQGTISGRFCLKEFCAIIFYIFKSREVNKHRKEKEKPGWQARGTSLKHPQAKLGAFHSKRNFVGINEIL